MSSSNLQWFYSFDRIYCRDCGLNVIAVGHYCMLRDRVWRETGVGLTDGVLCLDDIEQRLGVCALPISLCHERKQTFACGQKAN
jgi:hypothetical protein